MKKREILKKLSPYLNSGVKMELEFLGKDRLRWKGLKREGKKFFKKRERERKERKNCFWDYLK